MCKNLQGNTCVEHYYNQGYNSNLLDSSNPTLGLSSSYVLIDQGFFYCKYSRDNFNSNFKYFDRSSNASYILVAFGLGMFKNNLK